MFSVNYFYQDTIKTVKVKDNIDKEVFVVVEVVSFKLVGEGKKINYTNV